MCGQRSEPRVCVELLRVGGNMDSSCDDGTCYICMEGGAGSSKCGCIDRRVHNKCLMQWLKQQNKTHCDVCLMEYENVEYKISYKRKPADACFTVFTMSICSSVVASCGTILLYLYSSPKFDSSWETLAKAIALLVVSLCGFVVCFLWVVRFRREGWRFWDTNRRSEVVFTNSGRDSPSAGGDGRVCVAGDDE